MSEPIKVIRARFFVQDSGVSPVREWIKLLDQSERKAIGSDIMSVEFGWPIGMPTVRHLGGGLWEVRTNLKNKIARVFFCIFRSEMVLLHGIIKKDQKTPKDDLDLAKKRMKKIWRIK